jgi:hypothetical protein
VLIIAAWMRRRWRVNEDADALLAQMLGRDAWMEARQRGRDDGLEDAERIHWRRVAPRINTRAALKRDVGSGFRAPVSPGV